MKRIIRTFIEIDEIFQNVSPRHYFVLRILGIPVMRYNRMERRFEIDDDDDDDED